MYKRVRGREPEVLLGIAVVASALLLLNFNSKLSFTADEWQVLFFRLDGGFDQVLQPYYEHILIIPTLLYKLLRGIFGMDSARPFQVVSILTFQLTAVLFYIYVRRRTGAWAALIATILILFLGAAFEDFLFAFQVVYYGSLAAGIGALLALDRDDHKGDVIASCLLVLSLLFSFLAVPFIAGAVVELILNPRDRKRRIFVPGAAIGVYVIWWIGWGHNADTAALSFHNLVDLPEYIGKSIAAGFTSIAGLATDDGSFPNQPHLIWGALIAGALLVAAGLRIKALGRVPKGVWITAAIALTFYGLSGLNQSEFRLPTSSRYQLPSAIFLLLLVANFLKGVKIGRPALIVAGVLSALAVFGGISLMHRQLEERWEPTAEYVKVSLGAIDLAGDTAKPDYVVDLRVNRERDQVIPIGLWQEMTSRHGSPGLSEAGILATDPGLRLTADSVSVDVSGIELSGFPAAQSQPVCEKVGRDLATREPLTVRPGASLNITNGGGTEVAVNLSRFSDPPGVPIGAILPDSEVGLALPADDSTRNWQLSFSGDGPVRVCSEGS